MTCGRVGSTTPQHRSGLRDRLRAQLVGGPHACRFTNLDEAVDAFTRAYPHAPEDEYLADYIADVARDARSQ